MKHSSFIIIQQSFIIMHRYSSSCIIVHHYASWHHASLIQHFWIKGIIFARLRSLFWKPQLLQWFFNIPSLKCLKSPWTSLGDRTCEKLWKGIGRYVDDTPFKKLRSTSTCNKKTWSDLITQIVQEGYDYNKDVQKIRKNVEHYHSIQSCCRFLVHAI